MEGGTTMAPLTIADLIGPLASLLKKDPTKPDLLIGVTQERDDKDFVDIVMPLAQEVGIRVADVCCINWFWAGPMIVKTLTTHGSAWVDVEGEHLFSRIGIFGQSGTREDHRIWQSLGSRRNALLSQIKLTAPGKDFPYSTIRGNVLLCGDFSVVMPAVLVALRAIFQENGAKSVTFVTPAIVRAHCEELEQAGCKIVRLHPPECVTV